MPFQLEPHLRGPVAVAVSYDSCYSDNSNPYNKGKSEGECEANKIWDNNYGSKGCKRISSYDTAINTYINEHYKSSNYGGNNYQNQELEMNGAADGMTYVMKQKDSQCATSSFFVDIYSCRTVGIYSATQIAQRKCNYYSSGSFSYPNKSKLGDSKDCYTIANDDCQGNIDQMIQTYCNGRSNDYDFLKQLKDMCVNEVSKHLN